jgi:hypothetical protein
LSSRDRAATDADERALADSHTAAEVDARRYVGEILYDAIVVYACIGIHNHMPPNNCIGLQDSAGHDDGPLADFGCWGNYG